ncbi:MAG: hypothetical protein IMF16_00525 [Proteobacteria bacterium]|nr:hypothetical protein [Pseudomonadota bacterium]
MSDEKEPASVSEPTDQAIEQIKQQRFRVRVERVVAVMQEEQIDWRGIPFLTPDGRIGVRVMPVEMGRP